MASSSTPTFTDPDVLVKELLEAYQHCLECELPSIHAAYGFAHSTTMKLHQMHLDAAPSTLHERMEDFVLLIQAVVRLYEFLFTHVFTDQLDALLRLLNRAEAISTALHHPQRMRFALDRLRRMLREVNARQHQNYHRRLHTSTGGRPSSGIIVGVSTSLSAEEQTEAMELLTRQLHVTAVVFPEGADEVILTRVLGCRVMISHKPAEAYSSSSDGAQISCATPELLRRFQSTHHDDDHVGGDEELQRLLSLLEHGAAEVACMEEEKEDTCAVKMEEHGTNYHTSPSTLPEVVEVEDDWSPRHRSARDAFCASLRKRTRDGDDGMASPLLPSATTNIGTMAASPLSAWSSTPVCLAGGGPTAAPTTSTPSSTMMWEVAMPAPPETAEEALVQESQQVVYSPHTSTLANYPLVEEMPAPPATWRFQLGSSVKAMRQEVTDKIVALGSSVEQSSTFVKGTTHLVAAEGVTERTEKYLSACAAGIYIVPPRYISESFERSSWITRHLPDYDLSPRRRHPATRHCPPFQGWRVLLVASRQSVAAGLRTVLRCGGCSGFLGLIISDGGSAIKMEQDAMRALPTTIPPLPEEAGVMSGDEDTTMLVGLHARSPLSPDLLMDATHVLVECSEMSSVAAGRFVAPAWFPRSLRPRVVAAAHGGEAGEDVLQRLERRFFSLELLVYVLCCCPEEGLFNQKGELTLEPNALTQNCLIESF